MSRRQYFGTDGVRGPVGELLTPELVFRLGVAGAVWTGRERPRVLIVRDTRESGPMLEEALSSGVASAGGEAVLAGVLPTPAAAILCGNGYDLAAVISASHNLYSDNGVKFILPTGAKLDDEQEAAIEANLDRNRPAGTPGTVETIGDGGERYVSALAAAFELDLRGLTVALDPGNGATYEVAPEIFRRLGAEVKLTGNEPDGRNINAEGGSTRPEVLAGLVKRSGAAIGFAFDGDGDRVIAVDGSGAVRNGDELLALVALDLKRRGSLGGGVVVSTMTNHAFHSMMAARGVAVRESPVGDRYVQQALDELGWKFGGEQAGHLIWTDFTRTGDGIAGALLALRALGGGALEDFHAFDPLPQRLVNVEVGSREDLTDAVRLHAAIDRERAGLDGRGRIVVRRSGTEPVLRIMVEAPGPDECDEVIARLGEIAEAELGAG